MDVSLHKFGTRAIVINSSDNRLNLGKIAYLIESCDLHDRFFDIISVIPSDRFYVNLLRYTTSYRQFAAAVIPKKKHCSPGESAAADEEREALLEVIGIVDGQSDLTVNLLIDLLERALMDEIEPLNLNKATIKRVITKLNSIIENPLFNCRLQTKGVRTEYDFGLFVHANTPLFLYKRNTHHNNNILASLLKIYIESAITDYKSEQSTVLIEGFSRKFKSLFPNCSKQHIDATRVPMPTN